MRFMTSASCVALLLELGAPPHLVRDIAGHAGIGVTMAICIQSTLWGLRSVRSRFGHEVSLSDFVELAFEKPD
jgi:hypothetical protein